jgi:putative thiamine transport system ATP-binding protein
MLELDDLNLSLGQTALARLNLAIPKGQVLTLMAPSGAGKSSVLAAILGVLGPGFHLSGRVRLNGRDLSALPPEGRRIGLLFQDDLLFPHLSVGQNLGFGLPKGASDRQGRIARALEQAGLSDMAGRDPATLSGGERARVALMRALLAAPEALLLDEPFSRLDAGLRRQIRAFTFERARDLPVILVTHDADDARAAGGPVMNLWGQNVAL